MRILDYRQALWYSGRMAMLLEAIREAIRRAEAQGLTRYRIAKDTGVSQAALSRFMAGERGMGVEPAERLAEYLGLRITIEPKATTKAKTRKGR